MREKEVISVKLVIAVMSADDSADVIRGLTKAGFSSTKLSTTGGVLMTGNATLLVGVEDEKVQDVIDVIREHSSSRKQIVANHDISDGGVGFYLSMPVEVTVGGATIFVVDVDRFERV